MSMPTLCDKPEVRKAATVESCAAREAIPGLTASVVVPTYGRPHMLLDTLRSLLAQSAQAELIVVDNQPTGAVRKVVEQVLQESPGAAIELIDEPQAGLHNARHAGAKAAFGEIVVYVDDDVITPPGWLESILQPFAEGSVGIVGGKVIPRWEVEPPAWVSQFPPGYLSLLDLGDQRRELQWPRGVYGCNMAVRRSALFEAGGFHPDGMGDPALTWHRGDGETGLHRKIYTAGYSVIYEPAAWLFHRIPHQRLQASAFYQRGLNIGLSQSFSALRSTPAQHFSAWRAVRQGVAALGRAMRCAVNGALTPAQRIRRISDAWLWYGYGMQHLRAGLNPSLRAFLLKESYL